MQAGEVCDPGEVSGSDGVEDQRHHTVATSRNGWLKAWKKSRGDRDRWRKSVRCAARAADHHSRWDRETRSLFGVPSASQLPRRRKQQKRGRFPWGTCNSTPKSLTSWKNSNAQKIGYHRGQVFRVIKELGLDASQCTLVNNILCRYNHYSQKI